MTLPPTDGLTLVLLIPALSAGLLVCSPAIAQPLD